MQGHCIIFIIIIITIILPTKINPAPVGEEEGRMMPAARDSLRYLSIAAVSGRDSENRHPLGGVVPGWRSIAQSYGLYGGRQVARDLQKTLLRSWYSTGTLARFGVSVSQGAEVMEWAFRRQLVEQTGLQPKILCRFQSSSGLCFTIHGWPSTTGEWGVSVIRSEIVSWWFPDTRRWSGMVALVMRPNLWPLR